ncbi:MAG: hypothetical protein IJF71_04270 [Clostridia bacterium]|nr:hypothetical protein [Clostridia bacterium]
MFKIWAKTIINHKVRKNEIFVFEERFDASLFWDYLAEICYKLDLPTPVLLSKHVNSFVEFHSAKFVPGDFIDAVDFDELVLEDVVI